MRQILQSLIEMFTQFYSIYAIRVNMLKFQIDSNYAPTYANH